MPADPPLLPPPARLTQPTDPRSPRTTTLLHLKALAISLISHIAPLRDFTTNFAPDSEDLTDLGTRISVTYAFLATELENLLELLGTILCDPPAYDWSMAGLREMEVGVRCGVVGSWGREGLRLVEEMRGLAMEVWAYDGEGEGVGGGKQDGGVTLMEVGVRAEMVQKCVGRLEGLGRRLCRGARERQGNEEDGLA